MKSFDEDPNVAVITTKHVLEKASPILFVFHYEDGSWQFSGPETELLDEDYRVVSLEEIIQLDPTVLEVADLPYEGEAQRESANSQWTVKSQSTFG